MSAPDTIMEWCDLNQEQWQDCPRQVCEDFFSKALKKSQDLEYVPSFIPDNGAQVPIALPNLKLRRIPLYSGISSLAEFAFPTDPQTAGQCEEKEVGWDSIRGDLNQWRALQKLYHDAGWADAFNGEILTTQAENINNIQRKELHDLHGCNYLIRNVMNF
jgi:hypothetical protein